MRADQVPAYQRLAAEIRERTQRRYESMPREPGTVHLIPGHPVMPVCTSDDCPVCDLQGRPRSNA